MTVSIHQPSYFPWLGLLDKIKNSDVFIYFDTVQLADRGYQHRNIFLNNQQKEHLLTIPLNKKNYRDKLICEIELNDDAWRNKHFKFFQYNYKKHPCSTEIFPELELFYQESFSNLSDVLFKSMELSLKIFEIDTKIIKASDLNCNKDLKKEALILDILEKVNATRYLSGTGAKSYQNEDNFKQKGIELEYQNFIHPEYKQYKNGEFISGLSSLDVAFNLGYSGAPDILK